MTCSSNTRSTPERRSGPIIAAALLLAATIVPAQADTSAVDRALADARGALAGGDGIAAQAHLRQAQAAGARTDDVRALMGEALLAQGDLPKAREWLAPARFSPATETLGWRMLGRVELRARRLPEAGRAFDRALARAPRDPALWTDIARLRYIGGEQAQAIAAAEKALALDPSDPDALGFRALLVRNQNGMASSLPWFEAAIERAPKDPGLRLDHAATLADMGRYREALAEIRAAHRLRPGDPRILYIQMTIAARGGQRALARRILERSKSSLRDVPGAVLLSAALELEAGNANLAVELSDRLLRQQRGNPLAVQILARAMARSGDPVAVVARFGNDADRADASPYLLTLVARAYEDTGRRREAIGLLARAATPPPATLEPLPAGGDPTMLASRPPESPGRAVEAVPYIRALLALGNDGAAAASARALLAANPGAPDAWLIAGDAELARGDATGAVPLYQAAAAIRFGEGELSRLDRALRSTGRQREADLLVFAYAVENPQSRAAARLLATIRARGGQWPQSGALLEWIGARGGWRDPGLLADLAFARLRQRQPDEARRLALLAAGLQPANPSVRNILALTRAPSR